MNGIFYFTKRHVYYIGMPKDIAYDYLNFPIKTKFKVENEIHGKRIENVETILRRLF
jgi:hypothetical protein